MPKLTYHPQGPDDPEQTKTHGYSFEAGKAMEVSDDAYGKLKDNPWFKPGKAATEQAQTSMSAQVGERRPDSSIDVQYPPGVGMKTHPDAVKTNEGFVAPDSKEAQEAQNEVAKRPPGRPRKA